jgi:hypothetical protein
MDEALKRNFPSINNDSWLPTSLKRNCNFANWFKKFNKGYLEKITEELQEESVETDTTLDMVWESDVMDYA